MAVKSSSTGLFTIPTAPAVGTGVTSGAANTYTTNYVQLIASTSAALFITRAIINLSSTTKPTYCNIQLATGSSGSETVVGQIQFPIPYTAGATGTQVGESVDIWPPIPVANATRIAAKSADSAGTLAWGVSLQCIAQSNVVAEGSINETVNVIQINGQTASASGTVTFPNATLASTTNITAATGVDITKILGTSISTPATAGILDVNVKNIDNDAASASGTVTFPNATLASTTNITAGTITTVTTTTTATNVTTVNGLAAGVITAASIADNAITAAKLADGAIDNATFASGSSPQVVS